MRLRKVIKDNLYRVSPSVGEKCALVWDCIVPVLQGRMGFRASAKYLLFGLCPGFAGRFKYLGTRVYFPVGSTLFRLTCEKGSWEPDVTDVLCRLTRPNHVLFDVGANIGLTSIPVLQRVQGSKVLSFEPSPNSLPYLQRTCTESSYQGRWEVVPKAAGDIVGHVHFYVAAARNGAWDGLQDTNQAGELNRVTIAQTTLDTEWQRLGRPPVSCVKIDVEGAETRVLKGAKELIRSQRPYVVLEWSRVNLAAHGIDPGLILKYAEDEAYEVFAIPNLNPIFGVQALELQMRQSEMFVLAPKESHGFPPNVESDERVAIGVR